MHRLAERDGVVTLDGPGGTRALPPGRPVALGAYFLAAGGVPGRRLVTVYGPARDRATTEYYPYDPKLVFVGPLSPPEPPGRDVQPALA